MQNTYMLSPLIKNGEEMATERDTHLILGKKKKKGVKREHCDNFLK